jgi:hypothetical protein
LLIAFADGDERALLDRIDQVIVRGSNSSSG